MPKPIPTSVSRDIYCKELAHRVMEAVKSQGLLSAGWIETQESSWFSSSLSLISRAGEEGVPPWRQWGRESKFFLPQPFILFRPSQDRVRSTHNEEGIFFTGDSHVNLIQRHLTDTPRIMFNLISGYPVTQSNWHKINHLGRSCCYPL